MRKLKIVLIASSILLAIGGAFASRPCLSCINQPQYVYVGGAFMPAGVFGYDYYCFNFPGVCTYYQPDPFQPNYYAPCRSGVYSIIP